MGGMRPLFGELATPRGARWLNRHRQLPIIRIRCRARRRRYACTDVTQSNMPEIRTIDTSPKWFTEVELNLRDRWTESTIQYVPMLTYDDSKFTRIDIDPRAIPEPNSWRVIVT